MYLLDLYINYYVFQEDVQEEFGWKFVYGDVFRFLRKGMLFVVFNGSGVQIFFMMFIIFGKIFIGVIEF